MRRRRRHLSHNHLSKKKKKKKEKRCCDSDHRKKEKGLLDLDLRGVFRWRKKEGCYHHRSLEKKAWLAPRYKHYRWTPDRFSDSRVSPRKTRGFSTTRPTWTIICSEVIRPVKRTARLILFRNPCSPIWYPEDIKSVPN